MHTDAYMNVMARYGAVYKAVGPVDYCEVA